MMSQKIANRSSAHEDKEINLDDSYKECVRFMVCREGSKLPIKRAEIIKHLSTKCDIAANQVNSVIIEANKILKSVYGYKMVQVEAKSGIQYIIVLNEETDSMMSSCTNINQRKMLTAALTHIYMSGGPVKEDEMWKFLQEANLLEENDNNKKKILAQTLVGEGDVARFVFEWGQRAIEEVPKMFLLQKIGVAFEKSPDHWCEQYKEATKETEDA